MSARKIPCMLLAIAVAVLLAAPMANAQMKSLVYTGDLFLSNNGGSLCAKALTGVSPTSGVGLSFAATTLWGGATSAGPVTTNFLGEACRLVVWYPDLYQIQATGQGSFAGMASPPVALTVWDPDWPGVALGGRMRLNTYGVPPSLFTTSVTRTATIGVLYHQVEDRRGDYPPDYHPSSMPPGTPALLLYLDPLYPLGGVRVTAQNYTLSLQFGGLGVGIDRISSVRFTGTCMFQRGLASPVPAYLDAMVFKTVSWDYPSFSIKVTKYPATVVYQASSALNGEVILKCTGGHRL